MKETILLKKSSFFILKAGCRNGGPLLPKQLTRKQTADKSQYPAWQKSVLAIFSATIFATTYETHIHHIVFRLLFARSVGSDNSLPLLLRRTILGGFIQSQEESLSMWGKTDTRVLRAQGTYRENRWWLQTGFSGDGAARFAGVSGRDCTLNCLLLIFWPWRRIFARIFSFLLAKLSNRSSLSPLSRSAELDNFSPIAISRLVMVASFLLWSGICRH